MKLTKAQARFLELLAGGPCEAVSHWSPGRRLTELGLAEAKGDDWLVYYITPAGRAALKDNTND